MTCVYCSVEDKLSVCNKTETPTCIPKKKLKLSTFKSSLNS